MQSITEPHRSPCTAVHLDGTRARDVDSAKRRAALDSLAKALEQLEESGMPTAHIVKSIDVIQAVKATGSVLWLHRPPPGRPSEHTIKNRNNLENNTPRDLLGLLQDAFAYTPEEASVLYDIFAPAVKTILVKGVNKLYDSTQTLLDRYAKERDLGELSMLPFC